MEEKVCKSCGGTITRKGNFYVCDFCMSKKIKMFITSLVTAVIVAMISVGCGSVPNDAEARGYCELELSNSKEYYIVTDYNSSKTDVIIPSEYDGKPVKEIGEKAFYNCKSLTSITIPSSVTSIGNNAFYGCDKLTKVNHLGTIDSWVKINFAGSTANPLYYAKNLYINNQLVTNANIQNATKINNYAFRYCSSLTSVTIGNSVTSIGSNAFEDCTKLQGVVISNSVTSIGSNAFKSCTSLQSVTMGNSVTSIGEYAFYNCPIENATMPTNAISSIPKYQLKTVVINGGSSIGEKAFEDCTSLTSIEIPNSVTSIGSSAFEGCPIESATMPTIAISSIPKSKLTTVVINGGSSIGNNAFSGCTSLKSIVIPNSVTSIGHLAFDNCKSLTSVSIPNSVTSIGICAFEDCTSLTIYCEAKNQPSGWDSGWNSSTRPVWWNYKGIITTTEFKCVLFNNNTLTITDYIGDNASVTIPSTIEGYSVTSIGERAFEDCYKLTSIEIPNSVTSIGYNAFSGCPIESATMPTIAISYIPISKLKTVVINGGSSIGEYAFGGCYSLTSVVIPNSVTSIGSNAFGGCPIENATMPTNAISSIPKYQLKTVVINGGSSIGEKAFEDCTSLTSIEIPNSVTSIGGYAFSYCASLQSIVIPNSVTSIGEFAFEGCDKLTSVVIPNSVTSIAYRAFGGCSSLTIYCEVESKPSGWNSSWNYSNRPVVWGYKG